MPLFRVVVVWGEQHWDTYLVEAVDEDGARSLIEGSTNDLEPVESLEDGDWFIDSVDQEVQP